MRRFRSGNKQIQRSCERSCGAYRDGCGARYPGDATATSPMSRPKRMATMSRGASCSTRMGASNLRQQRYRRASCRRRLPHESLGTPRESLATRHARAASRWMLTRVGPNLSRREIACGSSPCNRRLRGPRSHADCAQSVLAGSFAHTYLRARRSLLSILPS